MIAELPFGCGAYKLLEVLRLEISEEMHLESLYGDTLGCMQSTIHSQCVD